LVAAGFDLLAVKPIDAIPVDEVVAAAGVGKGSFFNHFADKPAFAAELAAEVRRELEAQVAHANRGITDPLERIAGGMRVGAVFAMDHPKRAAVLLRGFDKVTDTAHPLNAGVAADFEAASRHGLLRAEAATVGVLYWLGLCQALMTDLLERPRERAAARQRIRDMMVLGLTGIAIDGDHAAAIADRSSRLA
jgi:AcrR family transcriptional regulator